MAEPSTIDVCIATFKRPLMLSGLLASLERQDLDGIRLRIVVIDNDHAQSARSAVEAFRAHSRFEVVYDVEPQQNIALARNRALSHVRSEYLVFIDDDESASPAWLQSLLKSLTRYDADIAFGPVARVLPDDAPNWARQCFLLRPGRTGEQVQYGGAGNVMMRRSVLDADRVRFNPAFGLTGGEDTDFFYAVPQDIGARRHWCRNRFLKPD